MARPARPRRLPGAAPEARGSTLATEPSAAPAAAGSDASGEPGARGRLRQLLLPYLVLVSAHLLTGLAMEQPLVLADEVGYLGNARYLSGTGELPDMRDRQFYHFGYSLALVPAFWLLSEPVAVYRAALAINALLAAALFFPLRYILVSFAHASDRVARWIAFVCCLYPPLVLYSSYAWSENAFIPLYALAAALVGRYLTTRATRDAVALGLVTGLLYTVHPRSVPILGVVLLYFFALALLRAVPLRQLLAGGSAMAVVVAVTRLVNRHLVATGWAAGAEVSATKLAARLAPGTDLVALAERAAGQLLYLSLATHGLFLVGLGAAVWMIVRRAAAGSVRRALTHAATAVPLFVLVTGFGILAASSTLKLYSLHGPIGVRGANFIHGRYNEAFAVVSIALALAELCRRRLPVGRLVRRAILVVAAVLCLTVVVQAEIDDALKRQVADLPGVAARGEVPPAQVDAVAVPGVFPLVGLVGALDLYPISLLAAGSFLLITATAWVSWRGGLVLLALLFSTFSFYNHHHYLLPRVEATGPRLELALQARRLGPVAAVSYDLALRERGLLPALQYLLPETVFHRYDSRRGEAPRSEAVVRGERWPGGHAGGARFVAATGRGGALWVLPGEMQSRLPTAPYEGLTLGAERRLDLWESGFHGAESFAGVPGRWTNGAAVLEIPLDPRKPPLRLEVETAVPARRGAHLELLANGVELWSGRVPAHPWTKVFDLEQVPLGDLLTLELKSNTFSPSESDPESTDERRLGVVVRGIRLTARAGFENGSQVRGDGGAR